jgi:hypothetical protein
MGCKLLSSGYEPFLSEGQVSLGILPIGSLTALFPTECHLILEELPESLDQTYEWILKEIRKSNQGHARRMLQCLVAAVRPLRPLRVEELAEVLAFDFSGKGIPKLNPAWRWEYQEEAVLSTCSILVVVIKDGDSRIVQFSHFSVKEYLTSDRLAESSGEVAVTQYHIGLEPARAILARSCHGVLLRLDDHINRENIKDFPLAGYAAQHWVDHARFGNVTSIIKGGIGYLFDADRPHFAAWLGSGFITKIGVVVQCLRCLRRIQEQSPYITPPYSDFVT